MTKDTECSNDEKSIVSQDNLPTDNLKSANQILNKSYFNEAPDYGLEDDLEDVLEDVLEDAPNNDPVYFIFERDQLDELRDSKPSRKNVNLIKGNTKSNDIKLEQLHNRLQDHVTQLLIMLISSLTDENVDEEALYEQFKRSDKAMHSYLSNGFLSLNKAVRRSCLVTIPSLLDIINCNDPKDICNANIKALAHELNMELPDYAALSKLLLDRRIESVKARCVARAALKTKSSPLQSTTLPQDRSLPVSTDFPSKDSARSSQQALPKQALPNSSKATSSAISTESESVAIKKKRTLCSTSTKQSPKTTIAAKKDKDSTVNWFLEFSRQERKQQK